MSQLNLLATHAGVNPLLANLNAEQRVAVTELDGPVLVVAAPGSGKTTVLTNRVAYMLEQGIAPDAILAVTFTKKAATEMAERVSKAVGSKAIAERLTIGTFHSICLRLLDGHYDKLGYATAKAPALVTPAVQRTIFELIAREQSFADIKFDQLAMFISRAKCTLVSAEAIKRHSSDPDEVRYAHLYGAYQKRLVRQNLMDFDDQIGLAVRLLETDATVAAALQARYTHVLVDEYQDTNRAQYELLKLLAGARRNLFAVGDDAQGIYGFRAADLNNILNFQRDYPGTRQLFLETNYRSTPQIVSLANSLIAHNAGRIEKTIKAARPAGRDSVNIAQYADNFAEAEAVAERIAEHIRGGVIPDEIAILIRTHAQGMPLLDALAQREIPFTVKKSSSFYEQAEVAETLSYLRLSMRSRHALADLAMERLLIKLGLTKDALAMIKVEAERQQTDFVSACHQVDAIPLPTLAQKGLIKHVLAMIHGWQRFEGSVAELYHQIISQTQYKAKLEKGKGQGDAQRLDCLAAMHAQIKRWEPKNVRELFSRIETATQPPKGNRRTGAVQIMTVHASKGLEWDAVFVVGVEEGVLPYQTALDDGDLSEERRLCYVAITRARRYLHLSYGRERQRFGNAKDVSPSRFLNEMQTPISG
ncbi:MAG: ATP-dependent helicase [Candidatus Sericytochromatia bacterium]|nr:ATP-dependent helicase [Candidatus Sericytochromatia bacterium]